MHKLLLGLVGMSVLFIGTCVNEEVSKLLLVQRYGDSAEWIGPEHLESIVMDLYPQTHLW